MSDENLVIMNVCPILRVQMDDRLKYIFEQIKHWLGFAEAKNAMLLVLNVTLVIAEADNLLDGLDSQFLAIAMIASLSCLTISTIIILYSFIPNIGKLKPNSDDSEVPNNINLLFYGDISLVDGPKKYLASLYSKYKENIPSEFVPFEVELASEIIYDSKITVRKYKLFRLGLIIDSLAIIIPLISLIIKTIL